MNTPYDSFRASNMVAITSLFLPVSASFPACNGFERVFACAETSDLLLPRKKRLFSRNKRVGVLLAPRSSLLRLIEHRKTLSRAADSFLKTFLVETILPRLWSESFNRNRSTNIWPRQQNEILSTRSESSDAGVGIKTRTCCLCERMNRNDRFARGARKAEDPIEAGAIVPHKRITLSYDFTETTSYTGDNALERIPRQQRLSNMPLSQKRIPAEDLIFFIAPLSGFLWQFKRTCKFFRGEIHAVTESSYKDVGKHRVFSASFARSKKFQILTFEKIHFSSWNSISVEVTGRSWNVDVLVLRKFIIEKRCITFASDLVTQLAKFQNISYNARNVLIESVYGRSSTVAVLRSSIKQLRKMNQEEDRNRK